MDFRFIYNLNLLPDLILPWVNPHLNQAPQELGNICSFFFFLRKNTFKIEPMTFQIPPSSPRPLYNINSLTIYE